MFSDISPRHPDTTLPGSPAPVNKVYHEAYWSGGAAEKSYVFVEGNALPQRMRGTPFTVAELGFGTGLNVLLTARCAQQCATPLTFVSYELHPLNRDELVGLHAAFPPELHGLSQALLTLYHPHAGWNLLTFGTTTLHLFVGDAAQGILSHPQPADAWFLDGFSPAANPSMWQPELLAQVYAHTKTGGTATTYSAARLVKDSLTAAGFHLERLQGFPPKKHMLKAAKA